MTPKLKALAKPRILHDSKVENPRQPGTFLSMTEAIVQAVRGGNTHADAALWAGVTPPTLSQWLARGLQSLTAQETAAAETGAMSDIPEADRPYAELAEQVLRADAMHRMKLVGHVNKAAERPDLWKAAVTALVAKETGTWRTPTRAVEVSGPGGGPVRSEVRAWGHDDARQFEATLKLREAERKALEVGEVDG